MAHGLPGEPGIPEHPSLPPDMEGAIDLTNPVQKMLTQFRTGVGKGGATACVAIALMPDGNIALSFHSPGGLVEILGMIHAASGMITNQKGPTTQ